MRHKDHIAFTLQKETIPVYQETVYLYTPGIVFSVVQNKLQEQKKLDQEPVLKVFLANDLFSFSGMGCCTLHTHVEGNISRFHYVMAICRNQILYSLISLSLYLMSAHTTTEYEDCSTAHQALHCQFHHIIKSWVGKYYMFMIASTILCNEKHMIVYHVSAKSKETRVDRQ